MDPYDLNSLGGSPRLFPSCRCFTKGSPEMLLLANWLDNQTDSAYFCYPCAEVVHSAASMLIADMRLALGFPEINAFPLTSAYHFFFRGVCCESAMESNTENGWMYVCRTPGFPQLLAGRVRSWDDPVPVWAEALATDPPESIRYMTPDQIQKEADQFVERILNEGGLHG